MHRQLVGLVHLALGTEGFVAGILSGILHFIARGVLLGNDFYGTLETGVDYGVGEGRVAEEIYFEIEVSFLLLEVDDFLPQLGPYVLLEFEVAFNLRVETRSLLVERVWSI